MCRNGKRVLDRYADEALNIDGELWIRKNKQSWNNTLRAAMYLRFMWMAVCVVIAYETTFWVGIICYVFADIMIYVFLDMLPHDKRQFLLYIAKEYMAYFETDGTYLIIPANMIEHVDLLEFPYKDKKEIGGYGIKRSLSIKLVENSLIAKVSIANDIPDVSMILLDNWTLNITDLHLQDNGYRKIVEHVKNLLINSSNDDNEYEYQE